MAKEPAAETPTKEDGAQASGNPVRLRDRFNVYPDSPLPDLATPSAEAFLAEDRRDLARPLFALVCRPERPVRVQTMRSLRGLQAVGLLQLVEWATAHWPPVGANAIVVVYERPLGGRVMPTLSAEIRRVDEYEIGKRIIAPLATALKELAGRGIAHRAIRPTNMFWNDREQGSIVLGDCVTASPAHDQPVLVEPVESGMSWPSGRGSGSLGDDMYALGASLVALTLGRAPLAGQDDEAVLTAKAVQGSYLALVGEQKLPLSLIEVLRGLLCDDPEQRWDVEKLDLWINGRRLSPLQTRVERRAQRGFAFAGQEYRSAPELAMAFARNWREAAAPLTEGRVELWVRRALEDKDRANAIAEIVNGTMSASTDAKTASEVVVARACMVLDPQAPIRYKGLAALPQGMGAALAALMAEKKDVGVWAECIMRDIPAFWIASRTHYDPEYTMLLNNFRDMRDHLRNAGFGGGIERCLYELNEALPCRSPLVAHALVLEVRDLLPALDEAAKNAANNTVPMDRHIAAFIAARFRQDVSRPLKLLNADDPVRRIEGILALLALVQWRMGPATLHSLARWVGNLSKPIIDSYHNRERRRRLERGLPRAIRSGNLVEIFHLLDDAEERRADSEGFAIARQEYQLAEQEILRLQGDDAEREERANRLGQQAAAMTSVGIGFLAATALTVMRLL